MARFAVPFNDGGEMFGIPANLSPEMPLTLLSGKQEYCLSSTNSRMGAGGFFPSLSCLRINRKRAERKREGREPTKKSMHDIDVFSATVAMSLLNLDYSKSKNSLNLLTYS